MRPRFGGRVSYAAAPWEQVDWTPYDVVGIDAYRASYHELLDVFEAEGVDTALWFTYAAYNRTGAADLGSYGVVTVLDDTRHRPRELFHAMAARYSRS
ncbi:hypothetical protein AB0K12_13590 [Nonomuraea sp. NPDC049419]|uniref:hypothetical protein n=1 Tax=Nonomuraea sp. NPDC049419 TaxID=3155772 RepID=UPI003432B42C